MKKILFIDRDGTLIKEPYDFQVDSLDKIQLATGVIPALLQLKNAGYLFVMITNQDGLGSEKFPEQDFQLCQDFVLDLFSSQGIMFHKIFICPHLPEDNCFCRKPKTGLLQEFLLNNHLDKNASWVLGDRDSDYQLAENLHIKYIPITDDQSWTKASALILNNKRHATVNRITKETDIALTLTLDEDQTGSINTPLPFFNHMLEQIAKNARFNLDLQAKGDIEVDDHHLIEDTAIALGNALKQALGDKWGINRYGFTLPMDESLANIAIDLSGRSFCEFKGTFEREFVGGMATEMVPHFFQSLANALDASIHIQVSGNNHHHMIEACFKVLGRALGQACAKTSDTLPTTKGLL